VAESLAGRVGIVQLDPLTPYELAKNLSINWVELLLAQPDELASLQHYLPIPLYDYMWKGGYPGY
jgi:predicted AAA+ superfamily ATPase